MTVKKKMKTSTWLLILAIICAISETYAVFITKQFLTGLTFFGLTILFLIAVNKTTREETKCP